MSDDYTYKHAKEIAEKFGIPDPDAHARREVARDRIRNIVGSVDITKLREGIDYPKGADVWEYFSE